MTSDCVWYASRTLLRSGSVGKIVQSAGTHIILKVFLSYYLIEICALAKFAPCWPSALNRPAIIFCLLINVCSLVAMLHDFKLPCAVWFL